METPHVFQVLLVSEIMVKREALRHDDFLVGLEGVAEMEVVSLETKLTEQYEAQFAEGIRLSEEATANLGRVAALYSGQLSFHDELRDKLDGGS